MSEKWCNDRDALAQCCMTPESVGNRFDSEGERRRGCSEIASKEVEVDKKTPKEEEYGKNNCVGIEKRVEEEVKKMRQKRMTK